jgi:heme exporter protein B
MTAFFRATATIFLKEMRIELRTPEIAVTAGLFGLLLTVLTSFAFFLDDVLGRKLAPGVLWMSASFAGVLAMGRSWSRERESDAIRGLLLAPVPRSAIYAGKALGTLTIVLAIESVLLPVVALLFRVDFSVALGPIALLLLLATIGYVAVGTLFAAMSVRTRARDLMLSIVLLPLSAPALIAGVVGTRQLLGGVPLAAVADWFRVLGAFDLVTIALGLMLFEPLMNE